MMEFHVSRQSRDRYQFDQSLFALNGNVIYANYHAARVFAQKMNQKRDLVSFPEQAVKAGQINAMGLIDEILHFVLALYRRQTNPQMMIQALQLVESSIGESEINRTLMRFTSEFPSVAVYRREISVAEYLAGTTDGIPNKVIALEEMLLLWVANKNPALAPFIELFDDTRLQSETAYSKTIAVLYDYFETQPPFGPDQQNLIEMLRSPAVAVPHSITGQLEYIRTRWSELLGRFLYKLLSSLDLIKEEEKLPFMGPGTVPIPIYGMRGLEGESENFTADTEWMPRCVVIAKNSYVWLDQLSKKYQQSITRLDQIPDAELDLLARWGFSGLWLIGLWERSQASARIKQLCGNPEAISSAYSLAAYQVASDLGGDEGYQNLRDRAWQRGIRLASDMVPNHMGIDSEWVIEHPDWFISLGESPFPSYEFNGPDLAPDGRTSIHIEDHYYNRSDAAVVFKRYDHCTGQTQFIYHGNDGTAMPWVDTAQLNYLNPQVREAVIQTILDVARKFQIIRFDAAMTLAKRHYQRLWFPEPGSGGDIPSRAGYGLTKEQFDGLMPIEFWREVVDRVAREAPDTLLLAEAFWLMEGYFVRTLGMHRVYNSAFMNLLRNEDNAKYRLVMKNTLEFDPEIMKRFVNFMNNPDERTAVDQFGKGDKYFGICALMATLPGLPMFGHGQIEGFSEKYGMEFRRAYWEEPVDSYLVQRHEREIFPLLHRRPLFAGVDNFLLYDFFSIGGQVNEDVFTYSNGLGHERSMVVYHNKFGNTQGWIRTSVGFSSKRESGERLVIQRNLGEGLNLHSGETVFTIFRDHINGLEYIRSSQELIEKGFFIELNAYEYHVFLDFHEIYDDTWGSYRQVSELLNGRGVPSIEEALKELLLQPVLQPFSQIANPGYFDYLLACRLDENKSDFPAELLPEAERKTIPLLDGIRLLTGYSFDTGNFIADLKQGLQDLLSMNFIDQRFPMPESRSISIAFKYILEGFKKYEIRWLPLLAWSFTHKLGSLISETNYENLTLSWLDEWQFNKILAETYQALGVDEQTSWRLITSLKLLISQQRWYSQSNTKPIHTMLEGWLVDENIQRFLVINRYRDVLWFNHESYVEFAWWMMVLASLEITAQPSLTASQFTEGVLGAYEIISMLLKIEAESGYQVNNLLETSLKENL